MSDSNRREFGKAAVSGALGAALLSAAARSEAAVHTIQPGIKLCAQSSAKPSDTDLLYLQ